MRYRSIWTYVGDRYAELISRCRKSSLVFYVFWVVREPAVDTSIDELLEYKGSSDDAAESLVSLWPRAENCLHSQRHMSMARKKNRGRIKIVPIKACGMAVVRGVPLQELGNACIRKELKLTGRQRMLNEASRCPQNQKAVFALDRTL